MPYNKPSDASLDAFLTRHFPAAQAAGSLSALRGLSGSSVLVDTPQGQRLVRQRNASLVTRAAFARQYRALRQLPADIAPHVWCREGDWLMLDYLPGEVKTSLPPVPQLAALLYHLHRQPRFGWRITLLPLLQNYWQTSAPQRRTLFWLRRLRALARQGEPRPLRLTPLHMDVHPGNLVWQGDTPRLIDWEYAGDGDVALELAAVWADASVRDALTQHYAQLSGIDASALRSQVRRWQPWVDMLIAGWYEQRFQQTQEQQFIALADEAWSQARAR
ncbi:thiamine kinase [Siccibacter colletis]|uniref:thiamine kinase n=1 Tax=Siccibacter colletis TaxID=1505757 RepID=UPI0028BDA878|nr:thiamine kinase [Siccibacter colletis]WNN49980.1 thiamine kinase [Siccibacter colletis]